MNFDDKVKNFKEFYDIDFCILGKTEIERKQNMYKVLEGLLHSANIKYVYEGGPWKQ